MTTALYRRYRPESFRDVIGQEHVTEPLMQALRTGRVNHAYLFSGPRGCGKTTSARILARCLNCEQGPTPEPCGVCDSCVALSRGGPGTIDVIEIDAASHGGVDDARDLRERASYGPAQSRYKIYIIDEAHMVTPQGFNALLKIVEEPPEHVKFVFATTEPEKVIGTIRSRTHHYPFRLVPPARLTAYMEQLCDKEAVTVAPGVLGFVTRAGGGSVRDSLSVLDQLIAGSGDEGLTYEGAASLLGFTDGELLDATIDALAAGDGAEVFGQVDRVIESGHDPRRFVEDLLERLRDLIIVAAVPEGAASVLRGVPEDQLERMRGQQSRFGPGGLSRAADIVNAGLTEMTGATAPRMQLELICARILLPAATGSSGYAARLDRLERRLDLEGTPSVARSGGRGPSAPPSHVVGPPSEAPTTVRNLRSDGQTGLRPTRVEAPQDPSSAPSRPSPSSPPTSAGGPRETSTAAPVESSAVTTPVDSGAPASSMDAGARTAPVDSGARTAPVDSGAPASSFPPASPGSPASPASPASPVAPGAPDGSGTPGHAGAIDTAAIRRVWPDVLARVFGMRRVTWTFLSQHAQVLDYDGNRLVLQIATVGLANTFRQGNHAELVRQALIDEIGVDVPVEGVPPTGDSSRRGVFERGTSSAAAGPAGRGVSGSGGSARASGAGGAAGASGAAGAAGASGSARPSGAAGAAGSARPSGSAGAGGRTAAPRGRNPGRAEPASRDATSEGAMDAPDEESRDEGWFDDERGTPPAPAATSTRKEGDSGRQPDRYHPEPTTSPRPPRRVPTASVQPSRPPDDDISDDDISDDDEDVATSGAAGRQVIERVLGGKVIGEFND